MTGEITSDNIVDVREPQPIRFLAKAISVFAHPMLVPLYVTCFLLFVHPLLFAGYGHAAKLKLLATVFVNLTMLPAITVFLCWRLKFIDSIFLNTQKERIIPLAAAMIFYFWCWFVLRNFTEIPVLFRQFLLGSFITIIMAWMANIYFKISLHALAMGGLFCFIWLVVFDFEGGSAGYIAMAAVIAGLVCTSRLVLGVHRPFEVYAGFILGALSQVLALWFN
ncbi:MAG: phosphatase PAP2 family protein [Chitinophagaceae bacterium]|nr:phosphatase PAP2 family protein [Chitinophagaceae bacterium]